MSGRGWWAPPSPEERPQIYWGFALVFVIAAGMAALTKMGLLSPWETRGVDAFLNASQSSRANDIQLVSIGDEDYYDPDLFDGQSPLRRACVQKLIDLIAVTQPESIVVDLDLSDPATSRRPASTAEASTTDECVLPNFSGKTSGASFPARVESAFPSFVGNLARRLDFSPSQVTLPPIFWAQTITEPTNPDELPSIEPLAGLRVDHTVLPIFPSDPDGRVRAYWLGRPVKELKSIPGGSVAVSQCSYLHTVAGALGEMVDPSSNRTPTTQNVACKNPEFDKEEFYLNFSKDTDLFPSTDAHSVLTGGESRDGVAGLRRAFEGKIVVIGGAYGAARDTYFTPMGKMPGMNLVALSIETEIHHRGARKISDWFGFLCDIGVGFFLVLLGFYEGRWLEPETGFALAREGGSENASRFLLRHAINFGKLSLLIISALLLPIGASLVIFRSGNFYLNFAPVVLGALIHSIYDWRVDGFKDDNKKIMHENKYLREELDKHHQESVTRDSGSVHRVQMMERSFTEEWNVPDDNDGKTKPRV